MVNPERFRFTATKVRVNINYSFHSDRKMIPFVLSIPSISFDLLISTMTLGETIVNIYFLSSAQLTSFAHFTENILEKRGGRLLSKPASVSVDSKPADSRL